MLYKFRSWWQHLGLILLGIFLIAFAHAFDDRKKIWIIYLLVVILLSFSLSPFQILVESILLAMFVLYSIFSKYPFSAFYKGFGWGLLFLLPLDSFNLWYVPISLIATTSEIFHEANHFEQDKKEGRFTTAHLLNFRISKEGRRRWKKILLLIGVVLLIYFYLK